MKIGNVANVDRIVMKHRGTQMMFTSEVIKSYELYDLSSEKVVRMEFNDTYELHELIMILRKFDQAIDGCFGDWDQMLP